MNWEQTILYEQPVNELVRVCLRLEQLFQRISYHLQQNSPWDSRATLKNILEVVTLCDRPELKTSLSKELMRHYGNLGQWLQIPNVDLNSLNGILDQLNSAIHMLTHSEGKLALELRHNEFLTTVRQQLSNIGGACNVNTPALNYWMNQPQSTQKQQLTRWLKDIEPIREIVDLLLKLIRESSVAKFEIAHQGFYETNLDSKQANQMIRVELPKEQIFYPEISAGRHRFAIRFFQPNFNGRDEKITIDVQFKITCCVL